MLGTRLDTQPAAFAAICGDVDRLKRRNHLASDATPLGTATAVPLGVPWRCRSDLSRRTSIEEREPSAGARPSVGNRRRAFLLLVAARLHRPRACTAGAPAATPSPPRPIRPTPPSAAQPNSSPSDARRAVRRPPLRLDQGHGRRRRLPMVPGTSIALAFVDGIQANSGCNQMFALYTSTAIGSSSTAWAAPRWRASHR